MPPLSLVPSLPAHSFHELEQLFDALKGVAKEFQVDIVDGKFVPHTSWPFTEANPIEALALLTPFSEIFKLEIDCMVREPFLYLDTIAKLGAKRVIIHFGSTTDYASVIAHARAHGYQIGFAATSAISLEEVEAWIPRIDFIQLMGILKVGQQGQPFDQETLQRARLLRARYPELEIAVDGAVNQETIPKLYAAGANRFAPGSAITKSTDPVAAYRSLATLLGI